MIAYVLINYNDCAKRVKFSAYTVVLRPLVKNNHRLERWNNNSSDKRKFTMTLICNRFKFNRFLSFCYRKICVREKWFFLFNVCNYCGYVSFLFSLDLCNRFKSDNQFRYMILLKIFIDLVYVFYN